MAIHSRLLGSSDSIFACFDTVGSCHFLLSRFFRGTCVSCPGASGASIRLLRPDILRGTGAEGIQSDG
jgi:hypothetical protein